MNWTLEKVMLNLNEALRNLDKNYPNKGQAHRAFGALMGTLNYSPPKLLIKPHGDKEHESIWVEVIKYIEPLIEESK